MGLRPEVTPFPQQAYWKVSEDKQAKCAEKGKSKQVIFFFATKAQVNAWPPQSGHCGFWNAAWGLCQVSHDSPTPVPKLGPSKKESNRVGFEKYFLKLK